MYVCMYAYLLSLIGCPTTSALSADKLTRPFAPGFVIMICSIVLKLIREIMYRLLQMTL